MNLMDYKQSKQSPDSLENLLLKLRTDESPRLQDVQTWEEPAVEMAKHCGDIDFADDDWVDKNYGKTDVTETNLYSLHNFFDLT